MGFMTGDKACQGNVILCMAGQGRYFVHGIVWLFTPCVKPCSVMLENARSVILNEMINDLLCMNPVKAEQ